MNSEPKQPQRVPTLTEVISDLPAGGAAAPALPARQEAQVASDPNPMLASTVAQETRIAERVIERLQSRIDVLLEHRLRESLAPAVAQLLQLMVDEARKDLARVLREAVAQAVNEELARHRGA